MSSGLGGGNGEGGRARQCSGGAKGQSPPVVKAVIEVQLFLTLHVPWVADIRTLLLGRQTRSLSWSSLVNRDTMVADSKSLSPTGA